MKLYDTGRSALVMCGSNWKLMRHIGNLRKRGGRTCSVWARCFSRECGEWEPSGAKEGKSSGLAAVIGNDVEAPSVPFFCGPSWDCCEACHIWWQVPHQRSQRRQHYSGGCRRCHRQPWLILLWGLPFPTSLDVCCRLAALNSFGN